VLSFAMFFIIIIINPILINEYKYNELIISYSNFAFSIGSLFGTIFFRYFLKYKLNYFQILKNILYITLIIYSIYPIYIYFNPFFDSKLYQIIYILLRLSEGFLIAGFYIISQYFIGYKLINNPYKGTINSLLTSKIMLTKFIAPILASTFILYISKPIYIYSSNINNGNTYYIDK
jgi:hypothetical protein